MGIFDPNLEFFPLSIPISKLTSSRLLTYIG